MLPKTPRKEYGNTIKKIKLEDSVGTLLAHDITEVRPGNFKGTAYSSGHRIVEADLEYLRKLGKRHLFIIDIGQDYVHENDAALKLAEVIFGSGISFNSQAKEGKVKLTSSQNGLFKVNVKALYNLNMIPEIICTSIHNNTTVSAGSILANIGVMPLIISRAVLNQAISFIRRNKPIIQVKLFLPLKIRLIVTGNEIYDGIIEDGFESIIRNKLKIYGLNLLETIILPDDLDTIYSKIKIILKKDTDLLITTGGMSIDPDDVTRDAIIKTGADVFHYGASVSPGTMFQLAYLDGIPIMGVPACALYNKITVFDLILPRLLTGEKIISADLAHFSHGGLCMHCKKCNYPVCPFGKG